MTQHKADPCGQRPAGAGPLDPLSIDHDRLVRINATMARYVPAQLADDLMHDRRPLPPWLPASAATASAAPPRVRSTLATILFVDIRGFSELSAHLSPFATIRLLDEFFSMVVNCIDSHGGMIDKFLGDGAMATFGVPATTPGDADRAVEAASAMLRGIDDWNCRRRAAGDPEISIGIGIDTGLVVFGTIGAATRMDYTVIGDCVNTAAKLQQASEDHGARALISAHTHAQLARGHGLTTTGPVCIGRHARRISAYQLPLSQAHDVADAGEPLSETIAA